MKFLETIEKNKNKGIDIYVDMDGVIAEYDIGNFDYKTIRPLKSNIKLIEKLLQEGINVYILTVCKSNQIINEKIEWVKTHMNFFPLEKVIFLSKEKEEFIGLTSKELKSNYLKANTNKERVNIVIDDDNEVIKFLLKNNQDLIVFQVSSWIE